MACSPFLSDRDLRRFRTKPCRRNSQQNGVCEFGANRCQYSHCPEWSRRCPFYLSHSDAIRYIPQVCPAVVISIQNESVENTCPTGWIISNNCTRGGSCPFAHSLEEVLYHPLVYKTTACVAFQRGRCTTYYCPFVHGTAESRDVSNIKYTLPFTAKIFSSTPYPNVEVTDRLLSIGSAVQADSPAGGSCSNSTQNRTLVPKYVSEAWCGTVDRKVDVQCREGMADLVKQCDNAAKLEPWDATLNGLHWLGESSLPDKWLAELSTSCLTAHSIGKQVATTCGISVNKTTAERESGCKDVFVPGISVDKTTAERESGCKDILVPGDYIHSACQDWSPSTVTPVSIACTSTVQSGSNHPSNQSSQNINDFSNEESPRPSSESHRDARATPTSTSVDHSKSVGVANPLATKRGLITADSDDQHVCIGSSVVSCSDLIAWVKDGSQMLSLAPGCFGVDPNVFASLALKVMLSCFSGQVETLKTHVVEIKKLLSLNSLAEAKIGGIQEAAQQITLLHSEFFGSGI